MLIYNLISAQSTVLTVRARIQFPLKLIIRIEFVLLRHSALFPKPLFGMCCSVSVAVNSNECFKYLPSEKKRRNSHGVAEKIASICILMGVMARSCFSQF